MTYISIPDLNLNFLTEEPVTNEMVMAYLREVRGEHFMFAIDQEDILRFSPRRKDRIKWDYVNYKWQEDLDIYKG